MSRSRVSALLMVASVL